MKEPDVDGPLVEACQQGDREALRVLFDAWKDRTYSLAFHYTRDHAAASDIVQEVFLKLFTRLDQFRGESSFGTWLFRLVVNACMDERRRRGRLVDFAASHGALSAGGVTLAGGPQEAGLARRQVQEAVGAAVARLSPKLRTPILLRYLEDLSYEEIAAVLGCSKGTVASRLNRGHRELARRLGSLRRAAPP